MSRWAGQAVVPAMAPTPPRSKGRGWTIVGLLVAAAGVGYYVLRPRVEPAGNGRRQIVMDPPPGSDPRTVAIVIPLPHSEVREIR